MHIFFEKNKQASNFYSVDVGILFTFSLLARSEPPVRDGCLLTPLLM